MADSVPIYVIGTAAVSAMMVATSVAISLTTEGDVADLLYLDCLATQNLGHAAFLVGFATSYWRGGHVLGKCFVVTAPWLLAAHGAASLAAAGRGRRRVRRRRPPLRPRRPLALYAAALPEPALYAEGYTLAFHVAFVSAVGLACADALERAPPTLVIYGAGFERARRRPRRSPSTRSPRRRPLLRRGRRRLPPRPRRRGGALRGGPAAAPPRGASALSSTSRRSRRRPCPARRPPGLAVAHGATFVGQALLAAAAGPAGSRFDRGVNFAIHGAGIFVFNAYLMFSDARVPAAPRHQRLRLLRRRRWRGAGRPARGRRRRRARRRPFAARAAVGAALGVALAQLPRDAHDRVAPPEKAPDREAPRTAEDPGPFRLGRAVRHQRSHFASLLSVQHFRELVLVSGDTTKHHDRRVR
ncbi:high-affinity potassium ion transmembrane transporter [Aureococcus anophagefferens]|nr:high-affinity potassium ion transmembrane transporter [Aureococcus anophagefferens]